MNSCAILCVDDESIILMSLKEELRLNFGDRYRYETAGNAKEAMDIIHELAKENVKVILVISDWLMPGIKGDEFLLWIKNEHPDIQAILITGHADPDSIKRALREKWARKVLLKPWDTREIIDAVKYCLDPNNNADS